MKEPSIFEYIALDAKGNETTGTLAAINEADAINQLRKSGLYPTQLRVPPSAKMIKEKHQDTLGTTKCPKCGERLGKRTTQCRNQFCQPGPTMMKGTAQRAKDYSIAIIFSVIAFTILYWSFPIVNAGLSDFDPSLPSSLRISSAEWNSHAEGGAKTFGTFVLLFIDIALVFTCVVLWYKARSQTKITVAQAWSKAFPE